MRSLELWKVLIAVPAVFAASCDGGSECVDARAYFEQQVWVNTMAPKCSKCHSPDGYAVAEKGAKFVLQPPTYPGFIDANVKMLEDFTRLEIDGRPVLLLKPIGKESHGGGVVLEEGSQEYADLNTLVNYIQNPPGCQSGGESEIQGITKISPQDTFRKAAINLAGRLPTTAEEKSITSEEALDAAIDGLMKEPIFLDRIREMFNDSIFTDKYDWYGDGFYIINEDDFPGVIPYQDDGGYDEGERRAVSRALAREPLNLIAYVVQQEKPITEILTANYLVVNPYSARVYGKESLFSGATDPNEFREVQLQTYDGTPVPHAGVLSTSAFLVRWPTTPTNRSRGRARQVYKSFLATDVLKLSTRPVDASQITDIDNPQINSVECNVCHKAIDPVAGAFRGWSEDGDYTKFYPDSEWHTDMWATGFGDELTPPDQYNTALRYLGEQIVKDPRFAIAMVNTVFKGLTGHTPLDYPTDPEAADYKDKIEAWRAQDSFLRSVATTMAEEQSFNLKYAVKAIVMGPYFRAASATQGTSDAMLAGMGTGHLLPPELMSRKIKAVTGVPWGWYDNGQILNVLDDETYQNYFTLYGGMDSDSVLTHLTLPNGTVAAVSHRMANDIACNLTAWDFTRPKEQRRFFPIVDTSIVPKSAGNEVPASVSDIKKNISYLHHLILGERLAENDPEVERTYQLFLATWDELNTAGSPDLQWWCRGRWDANTGAELPEEQWIDEDPNYTVRSWMAVMAYLMMDYKFMYE